MKKESGFIKGYYFHQLDNALHSWKRSVIVGFGLICLKSYWLFCLILSSNAVENTSYYFDSYYTNVFGASLLKGTSDGIVFVVAGLIVNSIIVLLICMDMIFWRLRENLKKSMINSLRMVLSFCAQTYTYAVFIPFAFHSIDSSESPLVASVFCLSSSIILNIFFLIHDQDYSFISIDGLDRRNSYFWDGCSITLEILSCVALSRFKTEGAFAFGAAYAGFRLLFIHQNRPFSSKIIQYIDTFSGIYILLLSFSMLVAEISSKIDSFPLVFLFLIPLSHKATSIFISKRLLRLEDFVKLTKYADYSYQRDGDVRQLLGNASQLAFEEYSHKLQSLIIEEIILNHKQNCQYQNHCFCSNELGDIDAMKESLVSGEERKRYLTEFICQFFERIISSYKRESTAHKSNFLVANFSFLSFASEKKGTKILAFKQVVKLLQGDNSYLQRFFLWRFHRNILRLFEVTKHNQTEQNHQTNSNSSQGGSDLFLGIRYDENLNKLENQFIDGMRQKIGFLTEIGGEHIDLVKLQDKAESYCVLRTNLIEQFKSLCKINQNSQKLQYFLESYIQLMAFVAKRKELIGVGVTRKYRNSKTSDDRSIFEKDNCVVFVSLQNKIGQLLRVQNKFENIFGYSNQEAIGNDLDIILPPMIANFHKNLLQDFHNQQRIMRNQVSTDEGRVPFAMAKDKQGWAIPCSIKFKTDFIGSDECGFTAHIKVLPIDASLLMTRGKSFILQLLTKPFFEKVLVKYFLSAELQKIHMSRVFPGLTMVAKKFETASNIDELEWHHTLGVLPRTKIGKQLFFNKPDRYYFVNLDNTDSLLNAFDFYLAKIKVLKKTNEYMSYSVIQILSFKKLAQEDDILHALHFYQEEYRVLGQEYFEEGELDKFEKNRFLVKKGIETLISEATQSIRKTNREDSIFGKEDRQLFQKATTNDQERSPVLRESINLLRKRTQGKLSQNLFMDQPLDTMNTGNITTDRKMLPTKENSTNNAMTTQNLVSQPPQQEDTPGNMNKSKFYTTALSHKEVVKLEDEEEVLLRDDHSNKDNNNDFKNDVTNPLEKSDLRNSGMDIIPEYENFHDGNLYNPNQQDNIHYQHHANENQHNLSQGQNLSAIQSTGIAFNSNNAISNNILIQQGTTNNNNNNSFLNSNNNIIKSKTNNNGTLTNNLNNNNNLPNEINRTQTFNSQYSYNYNQYSQEGQKIISAQASLVQLDAIAKYQNSDSQKSKDFAATVVVNSLDDGVDELGKSIQLAASSVQTGNTKNFEKQKLIKENVFSLKNSSFMTSITIFGFCSLVAILCLTVFEFVNVSLQLDLVKKCFSFISWPMDVRVEIVSIMKQDGLLKLYTNNFFSSINNPAFQAKQEDLAISQAKDIFTLYKQYIQSDQSELTFFQFQNMTMLFSMTHDEGLMLDLSKKFLVDNSTKYFKVFDIGYIIAIFGVNYGRLLLESQLSITLGMTVTDNFPTLNALLLLIQDKIKELSMSTLNSVITQVLILLIIVITVNALFVSSIFPIYYVVQKRKEYILQLFATIQPSHIKGMMQPVLIFLNENKSLKTSLFSEHLIKKRKAISETTPLEKFKPAFVFYSLVCFSIIIIQPIVNQILLSQFKTQSAASLNLLTNLYGLKALFMSNLGLNYEYINKVMIPTYPMYNLAYYTKRFPAIGIQNQQQLEQMYANITIAHSISMYKQDVYDQFLFKILQGNICEAIANYPEYVTTINAISNTECISVQNGILKKGFQLNTQSFFSIFSTLRQIYTMSNNLAQQAAVIAWEAGINLEDFDNYSLILLKLFNIILNFMLTTMNDQISNMGLIQNLLFSFQIIALFVVFFFGWYKFYHSIQNELFHSKLILSILSIDVILENPYIISYLNQ